MNSQIVEATGDLWDYSQIMAVAADLVGDFLKTFPSNPYLPKTPIGQKLYLQHLDNVSDLPPEMQASVFLTTIIHSYPVNRGARVRIPNRNVKMEFEEDCRIDPLLSNSCSGLYFDKSGLWYDDDKFDDEGNIIHHKHIPYQQPIEIYNEPCITLTSHEPYSNGHLSQPREFTKIDLEGIAANLQNIEGVKVSKLVAQSFENRGIFPYTISFDDKFRLGRGLVGLEIQYEDRKSEKQFH